MLFTKSRFKLALECPTKLFYLDRKDEQNRHIYKNRMSDDTFLQFLADGGHLVGEFAKFTVHESPNDSDITVHERGYEDSLAETNRRFQADLDSGAIRTVIAEAAIRHGDFFIRVDLLVADHIVKTLTLIEVKAKSVDQETIDAGFKNRNGFEAKWLPYLYDVAFQTLVAEQSEVWAGYRVIPKLMLVNKEMPVGRDGLHEYVRIVRDPANPRSAEAVVKPGTTRTMLGDLSFLIEVDMTKIVNELRSMPVPGSHIPGNNGQDLWTFMNWACVVQQSGERMFTKPDKRCAKCQFRARSGEPERSGLHECWAHAIREGWLQGHVENALDRDVPLSIDLWGGGAGPVSTAGKVLNAGHAFLRDVVESSFIPNNPRGPINKEFTPFERRVMQIDLVRGLNSNYQIQKDTLRENMASWAFPWHMIDFETSTPSVPFFKGMRPYQTVAFQFSHHRMEEDERVVHANQYIRIEADGNPNVDFVRELRKSLMPDGELRGTVFRYAAHENTVLRGIREEIEADDTIPDQEDLIAFINRIIDDGPQTMVNLQKVVLDAYISRHAGGSNSLKYILPAILKDAPGTAAKYSSPGQYGKGFAMPSLNIDAPEGHIWLQAGSDGNPYKTLPPLIDLAGVSAEDVDEMLAGLTGKEGDGRLDEGGLAMAAYHLTRYTDVSDDARDTLKQSLLRYCELDTLAMCMLAEGLREISN
jgi:hypothetical protein